MRVEFPFAYEVRMLRGRRRVQDHVPVRDVLHLDVAEVEDHEAPVVLLASVARQDGEPDGPEVPYRLHDGRLHVPVRADGGPTTVARFVDGLAALPGVRGDWRLAALGWRLDALPRTRWCPRASIPSYLPTLAESLAEREPTGPWRVVGHDREAALAEAHVVCAGALLVVDGTVWSSHGVHEPYLKVTDVVPKVQLVVTEEPYGHGHWFAHAFRADAHGDAHAFARALADDGTIRRTLDVGRRGVREAGSVTVLRPDLLSLDPRLACAKRAAAACAGVDATWVPETARPVLARLTAGPSAAASPEEVEALMADALLLADVGLADAGKEAAGRHYLTGLDAVTFRWRHGGFPDRGADLDPDVVGLTL